MPETLAQHGSLSVQALTIEAFIHVRLNSLLQQVNPTTLAKIFLTVNIHTTASFGMPPNDLRLKSLLHTPFA